MNETLNKFVKDPKSIMSPKNDLYYREQFNEININL